MHSPLNFLRPSPRRIAATFALIVLVAGATMAQQSVSSSSTQLAESVEVANHHVFGTSDPVDGATILIRNYRDQIVEATITSRALEADTAYSIWWAVFNRPQFCNVPYACTGGDLEINGGDPRVRASVFWGGGFVSDSMGYANTAITLRPGRTKRELFAQSRPYGLRNLRTAELHVVLRSHGRAGEAGPVSVQIGTASQACPTDGCFNAFASIHSVEGGGTD